MYKKIRQRVINFLNIWEQDDFALKSAPRPVIMTTAPYFKMAIPFIAGILLYSFQILPLDYFWIFVATSFPFLTILTFGKANHLTWLKRFYPFFLGLCLCGLSGLYTHYKDDRRSPEYFSQYVGAENLMEISINEMPVESDNSVKSIAKVLRIKDSLGWHKVSGNILLYFEKNDNALSLNYNDKLLVLLSLKEVRPPQNPYEFNYKKYLANKHIFYHSYIHENNWFRIEKGKIDGIYAAAIAVRKNFIEKLNKSGLTPIESAISSGMLLGWVNDIDQATLHEFSGAGITHILSVSGLHVGIISILCGYFLFFLNKTRKHRILKGSIQILILFLFAFITGLVPPVMRATFMFSFVLLGEMFSRSSNTFNTLGASALILLLMEPLSVLQVGFQLSFVALLGIVIIQPILFNFLKTRYKKLNFVLELITVSIAAQIITLPFILYYFHQFPTYFLIANIVIIPFSGILLGSIILVVFLSWIPWVGSFLVGALSLEIKGILFVVKQVELLPYSLISDIPFSLEQAWILAFVIFFGILIFLEKKKEYLFAFLSLFILFLGLNLFEIYTSGNQMNNTIYSLNKKSFVAEFSYGNTSYFVGNENFAQNPEVCEFQMSNNLIQKRCKNPIFICLSDSIEHKDGRFFHKGDFVQFGNEKYFFFSRKNNYSKAKCPVPLDYLVLYDNPKITIEELQNLFSFKTLIISHANSEQKIQTWKNDCRKLKQAYFSISEQGAFIEGL